MTDEHLNDDEVVNGEVVDTTFSGHDIAVADDVLPEIRVQPSHERYRNTDNGDRWYVVEVDSGIVANRIDQGRKILVQAVFGNALEIERRQGHYRGTTEIKARTGQARRVRNIRQARARNHSCRVNAGVDQ